MEKLFKMKKGIFSCLGIIVLFILMGNSNNVPEAFIQRIFKPIKVGGGTFYYAGFIVMVGIYYCLKYFNESKESNLINTPFKRFIVTVLIMNIFSPMWNQCIQLYKGFYNNINSIYLNREDTSVEFNRYEDKLIIRGKMHIVNCSNSTQKFQVKIKAPVLAKEDINKEYITLTDEYRLNPKKEENLYINEEIKIDKKNENSGYGVKAYDYIFFNDKEEALFKGKIDEYESDKLNS